MVFNNSVTFQYFVSEYEVNYQKYISIKKIYFCIIQKYKCKRLIYSYKYFRYGKELPLS